MMTPFNTCLVVLCCFCLNVIPASSQPQSKKWTVPLTDELESIRYPLGTDRILIGNGDMFWCYDATSGTQHWKSEIVDRERDGVNIVVVNDLFLVSSKKNTLQAYKASDGSKAWEITLEGIDQSDYENKTDPIGDLIFLRYKNVMVRINTKKGAEVYRSTVDLNLREHGAAMIQECPLTHRVAMFTDGHTIDVYDDTQGKRLSSVTYTPNSDLIEKRRNWRHLSSNQRYLSVVEEKQVLTLDLESGKELSKTAFDVDDDIQTITEDSAGCMLMGESALVFVSDSTGRHLAQPFSFASLKRKSTVKVGGKWTLWLSMKDGVKVIDQAAPSMMWSSTPGDKQFAGHLHGMDVGDDKVSASSSRLLTTMVEQVDEGDHPGTYLWAVMIDPTKGTVAYRTLLGVYKSDEPWYDYYRQGDKICFVLTSDDVTWSPETWTSPGEGVVGIIESTGAVAYRTTVAVCAGQDEDYGERVHERVADVVYVAGNDRILAFEIATGKMRWQTPADFKGQPFALSMIGDLLYAKLGSQRYTVTYTLGDQSMMAYYTSSARKDKLDLSKDWVSEPHGIVAIDPSNGTVVWNYSMEADPALAAGNFSVNGNKLAYSFQFDDAVDASKQFLYLCDLERVHAVTLGRSGGRDAWTTPLSDVGLGEIDLDDAFGYDVDQERLTQPVRMLVDNTSILVMGQQAIGRLDLRSGKPAWVHEWKYDREEVQYAPLYVDRGLVYGLHGHVKHVDLATGTVYWDHESGSATEFHSYRAGQYLITWDNDTLSGCWLRK